MHAGLQAGGGVTVPRRLTLAATGRTLLQTRRVAFFAVLLLYVPAQILRPPSQQIDPVFYKFVRGAHERP
jgi:hypothetical protein